MATTTYNDSWRAFLAAQLGVSVGTINDLEKQFLDTYAAGGLVQASAATTFAGNNVFNGTSKFVGNVGFYNTNPVAKPTVTGAKGANAALGSLMTALVALGLVTDTTSA